MFIPMSIKILNKNAPEGRVVVFFKDKGAMFQKIRHTQTVQIHIRRAKRREFTGTEIIYMYKVVIYLASEGDRLKRRSQKADDQGVG